MPLSPAKSFCSLPGNKFDYEIEKILLALKCKIPLIEVPVRIIYDKFCRTSHLKPVRDSVSIFKATLLFGAIKKSREVTRTI
jgi:hypothetical protein